MSNFTIIQQSMCILCNAVVLGLEILIPGMNHQSGHVPIRVGMYIGHMKSWKGGGLHLIHMAPGNDDQ